VLPEPQSMPSPLLSEPPLQPTHDVFHVDRILKPIHPLPKRSHKVIAVLPAYNARTTLAATLADFPPGCVDDILLVDDCSKDDTVRTARDMGLKVIVHEKNTEIGRASCRERV